MVGDQNNEEFTNQKILLLFINYFIIIHSVKSVQRYKIYKDVNFHLQKNLPTMISVQNMRVGRKLLYNCHLTSAILVSFYLFQISAQICTLNVSSASTVAQFYHRIR